MSTTRKIIGIDFGSSQSFVSELAIGSLEAPKILSIDGESGIIPTLLAYEEGDDKPEACGYEVKELMRDERERLVVVSNFKRYLGEKMPDDAGENIAGKDAEIYCRHFMNFLAQKVREYYNVSQLEDEDFATCLAYPATWSKEKRDILKKIAVDAGFPSVYAIKEPVAVVHALKVEEGTSFVFANKPEHYMVIDFGGGTLDICIIKVDILGSEPEVIATAGDPKLGGYEFTNIIRQQYLRKSKTDINKLRDIDRAQLDRESERAKIEFSRNFLKSNEVSQTFTIGRRPEYILRMSKSEMEDHFEDRGVYQQIQKCIQKALKEVGLKAHEIQKVILSGGSSQWFFMRQLVAKSFDISGDNIYLTQNPCRDVSFGCAIHKGRTNEPRTKEGRWVKTRVDRKGEWSHYKQILAPRKDGEIFHDSSTLVVSLPHTSNLFSYLIEFKFYKGFSQEEDLDVIGTAELEVYARSNWPILEKGRRTIDVWRDVDNPKVGDEYQIYLICRESDTNGIEYCFEMRDPEAIIKKKAELNQSEEASKLPNGKITKGKLIPGYLSKASWWGFATRKLQELS